MTVGERVVLIRTRSGQLQKEFAESIGISTSSISRIEKDQQEVSAPVAKSICLQYHISYEWLMTGEGEMISHDESVESIVPELVEVLSQNPAILKAVKSASETMSASDWKKLNDFIESLGGNK